MLDIDINVADAKQLHFNPKPIIKAANKQPPTMLPAMTMPQRRSNLCKGSILFKTGRLRREVCSVNNSDWPMTTIIKPIGYSKEARTMA